MSPRFTQEFINGCIPLDAAQSANVYVRAIGILYNLEFLQEFLDMAIERATEIEANCVFVIRDLIHRQTEELYSIISEVCPDFEKIDSADTQEGKLKH